MFANFAFHVILLQVNVAVAMHFLHLEWTRHGWESHQTTPFSWHLRHKTLSTAAATPRVWHLVPVLEQWLVQVVLVMLQLAVKAVTVSVLFAFICWQSLFWIALHVWRYFVTVIHLSSVAATKARMTPAYTGCRGNWLFLTGVLLCS